MLENKVAARPAVPAITRETPTATRPRPSRCDANRAWTHAPPAHDSVVTNVNPGHQKTMIADPRRMVVAGGDRAVKRRQLADDNVMPLVAVYNNAGAVAVEAARAEKKPEERTRLLARAITLLSRAADSSPDDATVLFNYGYALFLNEKYAEAAEKLEHVVASDPRDGQAYFLLAKAQERAGKAEPANAADNKARIYLQTSYAKWQTEWQKSQTVQNLNLRSRDVLNQTDLSDLHIRQTIDSAKADNTQESLNKIKDLYQQGRDDEAMVEIRKLLAVEQTNAEAFLLSGRIQQRRGDQEAAIAALKTAIFWENTHPLIDAHILLGRIFLERGDLGEARKYAASAMTIDPNNQEAIALQRQVTMGRP